MSLPHGGAKALWADGQNVQKSEVRDYLVALEGFSAARDLKDSIEAPRGEGMAWRAGPFSYIEAAAGAVDHHLTTAGGVKLYIDPFAWAHVDLALGVKADGAADDTGVYASIAGSLPSGQRLEARGSGQRIVGGTVEFPANDAVYDLGTAGFKKKDATPDVRQLLLFTGSGVSVRGGRFDCNVAAGGMDAYVAEDRLNTVSITGDDATIEDAVFEGSYDFGPSAALFLGGARPIARRITINRALQNGIRVQSDRALLEDIVMHDADTSVGGHGIVLDTGLNGAAFKTFAVKGFTFISGAATAVEAFLVDHDGVQGGSVYLEDFYFEIPNCTGPDVFKVAFCDDVTFKRVRGQHGFGSLGVSLRVQDGVTKVVLDDCHLPASISQYPTGYCDYILRGGTHIGTQHQVNYGIFDFAGNLLAERGTKFSNIQTACVAGDSTFPDSTFDIGACHFHGTGPSPHVVVPPNTAGTIRRLRMGQIKIAAPLSTSGTFRSYRENARWVAQNDAQELTVLQDGRFLAPQTQFPLAAEVEGCERGMIIWRRDAAAGTASAGQICVWRGAHAPNAWTGSATYSVGDWVHHGGQVYGCISAGVSAAAGGPAGTGDAISDNGVIWKWIDQLAVWKDLNAAIAA